MLTGKSRFKLAMWRVSAPTNIPSCAALTTARVTGIGKREPVPPGAPEPPVQPVLMR